MKATVLILTLLFTVIFAQAGVLTVSNNPAMPAEYADFSTAQSVATANDTLYVYASPNAYPMAIFSKPLTIIEAGAPFPDRAGTYLEIIYLTATSSGIKFSGCAIGEILLWDNISDLTMERCSVGSLGVMYTGYTITNGLFYNNAIIYMNTATRFIDTVFTNNIFNTVTLSSSGNVNLQFDHNYISSALTADNAIFVNNIINAPNPSLTNSSLINNMSTTAFSADGTNTLTGNIVAYNFGCIVPEGSVPAARYWEMSYFSNYIVPNSANLNLTVSSPGKNAGTDGTDLGVYGGAYPFVEEDVASNPIYRYFPVPAIPQMTAMLVLTPAVRQGHNAKATFKASKQN